MSVKTETNQGEKETKFVSKALTNVFFPSKQAGCLSFGIYRRLHMPGITEEMKQRHNLIHFPRTVQPALEVEKIGM